MKLMFELVLICGLMRISRFQCVHEKEYFCSSIPTDFPEGLTSVIFVVTKIGVLNSTDFGFFLQELMNASLLEDASSVTCQSPAGMKGVSVWNISDFNCSPELPSPFLTSVFHKVGLPLVLMCLAFLSFLLLLLLLWVVKRDKKQVQPGREATVEDGDGEQKGPMNAMTKKIRNNRLYEEKSQQLFKRVREPDLILKAFGDQEGDKKGCFAQLSRYWSPSETVLFDSGSKDG
ncbi:hypothetical protein Y1Q_0005798 [Alligator mississippiensis]|uniref:Uncharacterized protein n=1 Tax=Alligator mississippiensis TaxID=8496 RepID=A0A151MFX5_ALLMI|nr:hypothetical protein Y1Q_0005798 [Alligator mississippiensis]